MFDLDDIRFVGNNSNRLLKERSLRGFNLQILALIKKVVAGGWRGHKLQKIFGDYTISAKISE